MAYENLCMYCFKEKGAANVCPHCGKDERTAVPQIQLLPGTTIYNDRFLVGRALGQDANGIVYNALDTRKGGIIRIREYLPRNCAQRLNDGGIVPVAGMEDAFDTGMRKLRASVEGTDDPKKRHFYFEENGTAYIAQRKTGAAAAAPRMDEADDDYEDERDHRRQIIIYICIAAAVVLGIAIALIAFLNSMDPDDVTIDNPQMPTASANATWMPNITPTPTPYATATFAALVDPELSWMDYTYSGDVNKEFDDQVSHSSTKTPPPFVQEEEDYSTISGKSSAETIRKLQNYLVKLGWLDASGVTGKYDAATKQAVKEFQNYVNENCSPAKKLAVDGIAGEKTQQWLFNSNVSLVKPTPTPEPLVTAAPDDAYVDENTPASIVRDMQKKLVALGLLPKDGADGTYGPETVTAVKNFQNRVNQLLGYNVLEVSGTVDELTMAYLNYYVEWWEENRPDSNATPTPAPTPTAAPTQEVYEPGEEGEGGNNVVNSSSPKESVKFVQEMLAHIGLLSDKDIDGDYGRRTTNAVIALQEEINRRNGEGTIFVTGECDSLTLQYLEYCYNNDIILGGANATEAPTSAATEVPTQAPTEVPTQAPTEAPETGEINPGSSRERVAELQQMLEQVGLLNPGSADGVYGSGTTTAVKNFQNWVNEIQQAETLMVSGVCDELTYKYLEYCIESGYTVAPPATEAPTAAPTAEPTAVPQPTEEVYEPGEEGGEGENIVVNGSSPKESITFVQEMLAHIGLISPDDVDGDYGRRTTNAVIAFQEEINRRNGEGTVNVTGECDGLTLQYLEYCYNNDIYLGGETATEAPTEAPTEIPTEAPTQAPTEAPDEKPVGAVENFYVGVSGMSGSGGFYELEPGKYSVEWGADSGVESYYVYLYDGSGTLINSADATNVTGLTVNTNDLVPGEVYTLKVGAMPENGTQEHIIWNEIQLMLPIEVTPEPTATPEPTPEPTREPSVGTPVINIGSSAYQEDGLTYVTGEEIIFSWSADGDVESYTVTLYYEDGTEFPLGNTTSTSKTVQLSQLMPGRYRLAVQANAYGGYSSEMSELYFAVPAPEITEEPVPEITEPPVVEDERIFYVDDTSSAEDVQTVQMALYRHGLIDADAAQIGVLDEVTLSAIAAFQEKVNAYFGANLYIINPMEDRFIDQDTLNYLLYQDINING